MTHLWATWLACDAAPPAPVVPAAPAPDAVAEGPETGLIVGTVVGIEGDALEVRGCGAVAKVDPAWSTWAMRVERSATPCVLTLYDGERSIGGHEAHPGYGSQTLCALRPSLGVVVRRSEGGLVVVEDHHPDQLLRAGDVLAALDGYGPDEGTLQTLLARQKAPYGVEVKWLRAGKLMSGTLPVVSACDDPITPRLWKGDGNLPVDIDRAPLSTFLF